MLSIHANRQFFAVDIRPRKPAPAVHTQFDLLPPRPELPLASTELHDDPSLATRTAQQLPQIALPPIIDAVPVIRIDDTSAVIAGVNLERQRSARPLRRALHQRLAR